MVHKTYRYVMRSLLGVGLLLLMLCAGFYAWVVTGPRTLPSLNPYLEKHLVGLLPGYHFHIKTNVLQWDKVNNTLDIRLKDIAVEGKNNKPLAVFPEVKINLTLAYLFLGKVKPTELVVLNPAFKLFFTNGNVPQSDGELYQKISEKLLVFSRLKPEQAALQNINIRDADILIATPQKEWMVHIDNIHSAFTYEEGQLHINNHVQAVVETHPLSFDINLTFPNNTSVRVETVVSAFPSALLKDIIPDNHVLDNVDLVLNGRAIVNVQKNTRPVIEHFTLSGVSGSFSHPTYFLKPVTIKDLSMEGSVEPDYSQLNIETMKVDFGGAKLDVSGFIKQKDMAIQSIVLNADATKVPVDDIRLYWPSGLKGNPAREWVVQRISKGIVPKAYAKLRVSAEDIAQKHLSADSLEASVDFEGADVNYFDAYPLLTDVSGTAKFTGKSMEIVASKGKILHSDVTKASVTIADFMQHPAVLNITGEAVGQPADAMGYFKTDKVNAALSTKLEQVTGKATTSVNLSIPLMHPLTVADMAIDITSQGEGISLPKFLGKYDLTQGAVHFHFNGSTVYLDGKTLANGVPIAFNTSTNLPTAEQTTADGAYEVKGVLTPEAAKALRLPESITFTGESPFTLAIHNTDGVRDYQLDANMNKAGIKLESLGWEKAAGENMRLAIKARGETGKPLQVSTLEVASPKTVLISGKAQIQADLSAVDSVNLSKLRWGKNDLAVVFSHTKKGREWKITGDTVDLSQARFGKLLTSSADDGEKSLQTSINLRRVIMKNGEVFTNASGHFNCHSGLCQEGSFNTSIGKDGSLSMQLKPGKGKSGMNLESNRADAIARALDVFKNMQGGRLYLDAEFSKVAATNEQPEHNFIQGLLRVEDFRATKTPILAKIASLASFEGIGSLLENKGIKFKRLYAPFKFENETIFLDDSKAYGEALGITAKGRIYTAEERLNLTGTFVPSYAVNNILGKIPLVGEIGNVLMGGKGQGILAVRYKVKGPYANAEVTVNPLSILTPGFLRNLFDIVDNIVPEKDSELAKIMPAAGK